MNTQDFTSYISPLSWRYGSSEMKQIFSEENKYRLWRKIWIALARAQQQAGLVSKKELDDLIKHENDIDIPRIIELEEQTHHDVVAAIKQFAEVAPVGGGKIHLGATSMDVVDNADALRTIQALELIEDKLVTLLNVFSEKIIQYASVPCMGYTHLQPAEPTTVGYRISFYAQDLFADWQYLQFVKSIFAGKGMKGAVGTRASYVEILNGTKMTAEELDSHVATEFGIPIVDVATQVYPRKFDYFVLSFLASIGSSLAKFAGDLRLLQSPTIGEWAEPFGKSQVGSSAMPFKRNPINSEKICSLARYVAQLPPVALENASLSYLERTLDDSANKRIIISEGFIATDEILKTAEKLISGLTVNDQRVAYNLNQYGPFAATEMILVKLVKKGANRQEMHELLRTISMEAWTSISQGKESPMAQLLFKNAKILQYLNHSEITIALDIANHVGDAPKRAIDFAKKIKKVRKK